MTVSRRALGRWPNAPLALVLAQVRFEPAPETTPQLLAERIQQFSGSSYPHISPLQQVSFILGQGTPPAMAQPPAGVGLDLRNSENSEAIRLQPGLLTFTTSSYQDSNQFARQWRTFMDALCEERELRVMRLGLRYVDFIIPSVGHVPEDYFRDGIGRSPAVLGDQSPVAFNLYDFARENGGQLRMQYSRGFGPPALPPDLQDSVLPPAKLTTKTNSDISAVLDMDRWRPVNGVMSAETIASELQELRADIALSFKSVMTELADTEWKRQPTEGDSSC